MLTRTDVINELVPILDQVQANIDEDCRASDDPDDETPAIQFTVGLTVTEEDEEGRKMRVPKIKSWGWQSGDNSFSGGAYGEPHWGVGALEEDTNTRALAKEIVYEAFDLYFN